MTRELSDTDIRALLLGCTHYDPSPLLANKWYGVIVGESLLNVCWFEHGKCFMCDDRSTATAWTEPAKSIQPRNILTGELWCDER